MRESATVAHNVRSRLRVRGSFSALLAAAVLSAAFALPPASGAQKPVAPHPTVELTVENRGKVVIELFPRDAPKTVAHFVELAKRKFYDGLLFHRVVPGFVAQAGDPASKSLTPQEVAARDDHAGGTEGLGNGGSGAKGVSANIAFEENDHSHETGAVALALNGPRSATGDSQFFIDLKPNHSLDGDSCVFGRVIKGMDVVQKIKRGDRILTAVVGSARATK